MSEDREHLSAEAEPLQPAADERSAKKAKKEKEKKPLWREILEWVLTLLVALMIALPVRIFIFEPVRVDGHSMDDTLANGEIMYVSKTSYGSFWLAMPWWDAEGQQNARRFTIGGDPERFDVVICRYPDRGGTNFVKRVVGLPGDRVAILDGHLFVNGERYEEPYINDDYRTGSGYLFPEYTVPEGYYFVMGDHRNNSNDSRYIGPITRDMIMGKVTQVLWPLSSWRGVPNGLKVQ